MEILVGQRTPFLYLQEIGSDIAQDHAPSVPAEEMGQLGFQSDNSKLGQFDFYPLIVEDPEITDVGVVDEKLFPAISVTRPGSIGIL